MLLGPNALGITQFGEHFGDYATIPIAAVFGALPFTMDFNAKVRQRANDVVLFRGHIFRNCRWRYLYPPGFKEGTHQRARLG